jgi:predicted small secreted protein
LVLLIIKRNRKDRLMNTISKEARVIFMLGLFALASLSLAACETMEGAGQDIEKAGEAIQKKANE